MPKNAHKQSKKQECPKYYGEHCGTCKFACRNCLFGVMAQTDNVNNESYEGYCQLGVNSCKDCPLFLINITQIKVQLKIINQLFQQL
jgi:hypothetical protein